MIFINFFRQVFSECTEAITTSLIPLETILPVESAFIFGFSCTVQGGGAEAVRSVRPWPYQYLRPIIMGVAFCGCLTS